MGERNKTKSEAPILSFFLLFSIITLYYLCAAKRDMNGGVIGFIAR